MVLWIKRVWSNKNTLKIINECNCTLKGEQVSLSFFFKDLSRCWGRYYINKKDVIHQKYLVVSEAFERVLTNL